MSETRRIDTAWDVATADSRLGYFEKIRALTFRATQALARDVLDPLLQEPGTIVLEIGAGTGFARRAYPVMPGATEGEGRSIWIQSDPEGRNAVTVKAGKPEDVYTQIDVHDIPLPDSSVDVVVGWASIDVVSDLPHAMSQIVRVLKPGGSFVHFIDAAPNTQAIKDILWSSRVRSQFNDFMSDRQGVVIRSDKPKTDEQKRAMEGFAYEMFGISNRVDIYKTFANLLAREARRQNLEVLLSEKLAATYEGPMTSEQTDVGHGVRIFIGDIGKTSFQRRVVGTNAIEVSNIGVFVAKKPLTTEIEFQ